MQFNGKIMNVSQLTNARVIVTGATGFIGANLIARLIQLNAIIYAPIRAQSKLWRLEKMRKSIQLDTMDLTDFKSTNDYVKNINPSFIFHLAVSRDTVDWRSIINTNIIVTIHLLKACASNPSIKFIHAGSSTEYGNVNIPYLENDRIKPNLFFGCSKAAATQFVMQATEAGLIRGVVARLFSVYGGYNESHTRFIPKVIRLILNNQDVPVTEKNYQHDFIFIDDVIDFFIIAAINENAVGNIFNVGAGVQWSNLQLIEMIGKILNVSPKIQNGAHPKNEYDRENWVADITLAKEKLGWTPKHNLYAGLTKIIARIKENDL